MSREKPHILSPNELTRLLAEMPDWKAVEGKLKAEFSFPNFRAAMGFMLQVAIEAEIIDHHPDWSNLYNRVFITLSTHSVGNQITDLDIRLAKYAGDIAKQSRTP